MIRIFGQHDEKTLAQLFVDIAILLAALLQFSCQPLLDGQRFGNSP